ncbi:MAG TPA: hypothetical protein VFP40_19155, partial [Terriglobales bacterium]|nr:hypothetical protein [Terriglobales bacterium]
IVVFLTDGYVGNDFEIISEVKKHANARVFAYGIGSSVNRFLITKMAEEGRGEAEIVSSEVNPQEADEVADRLYQQLRSPLLTDISLDFGKLPVSDVYPARIPDLFGGRPVVVTGRYIGHAEGVVRLHATRAGQPYEKEVQVNFSSDSTNNAVLPNLWARAKISDLMSKDWSGGQQQAMSPALQKEVTQIGLKYGLMTQFTSFVAVEERITNVDGKPTRVQVPVELPQGMKYEEGWDSIHGFATSRQVGAPMLMSRAMISNGAPPPAPIGGATGGVVGGISSGSGAGVGGGIAGAVYKARSPNAIPDHKETAQPRSDTYNLLAAKARPEVLAAYECWEKQKDEKHTPESSCAPADRVLHVEIVFSGSSADAIQQLTSAGFKSDAETRGHQITGVIALDRLPEVAAIKQVQLIALRR